MGVEPEEVVIRSVEQQQSGETAGRELQQYLEAQI
jgi:hypothetical protein